MDRISRRSFLRLTGMGVVGVGMTGVLAACSSPAPSTAAPTAAPPAAAQPTSVPAASAASPAASPSLAPSVVASPSASASPAAASVSGPVAAPAGGIPAPDPSTLASTQQLVSAVSNLPASTDPHFILGGTARRFDLYEMLYQFQPDGSVVPMLAGGYQMVNPTTHVFKIRPDAVFHTGDPLTADDVKFSMDRATRKESPLATAGIMDTYGSATVNDPSTVTITSTVPDVLFLKKLARIAILPQKYYMGLGSDDTSRDKAFQDKPVGSGPYQFVEFQSADHLTLKKFAGHKFRKAILTDITIRQISDPAAQKDAFLSGDAQYFNLAPVNALDQITSAGGQLITVTRGNSLGAFMDPLDQSGSPKTGPTGNKLVRQALNYAIDKDTLVKSVLAGQTFVESGQIPSHDTYGFDPNVKPYPYDPDMAAKLLDQAGFPNGGSGRFNLSMASAFAAPGTIRRDIGEYVAGQIQKLGVQVDYTPITDVALATDMFYNRTARPDIYHFGLFTRPYLDPSGAYNWFRSDNPTKHYNNPQFDQVFAQSGQELDSSKREQLLWQCTEILHEDAPYLFLSEDFWVDAAAKQLQGTVANDAEVDQFYYNLYFTK
jgi:peptide/nickel transport system substrate-binding protein